MPAIEKSRISMRSMAEVSPRDGKSMNEEEPANGHNFLKVSPTRFTFSPQRQQSNKDDSLNWIREEQECVYNVEVDRISRLETAFQVQSAKEKIKKISTSNAHFIPHADTQVKEEIEIVNAYNNLKNSQTNQLRNMESIHQISSLENQYNTTVKSIATTVTILKNKIDKTQNREQITGSAASIMAQSNLLHDRTAFEYLLTLNKLVKMHTLQSADYYMFFREIEEYASWMRSDLAALEAQMSQLRWKKNPEISDVENFLAVIQDVALVHSNWEKKLRVLTCRANHLVPIPQRLLPQAQNTVVICLADYKAKETLVKKSEELHLMSSCDENIWKVRNLRGCVVDIPALFIQIPGPAVDALAPLQKLKQEFLTSWTNMIKKSGLIFLAFLTTVFKDWNNMEQNYIQSMCDGDKEKMRRMLNGIRQLFLPFWKVHPIFQSVDEKMRALEELQNVQSQPIMYSESEFEEITALLLKNPEIINQLMTRYEEFWTEWLAFKTSQENGKYEGEGKNKNKLQKGLSFASESDFSFSYDEVDAEFCGSEVYMIATAKETTESSQYSHSEQEERQTFVITGVKDPCDGTMISLDDAVLRGIINQEEGKYVKDLSTGESIPIPLAMNSGFIKVELTRTKKFEEKKSELGLVTLHTHNEKRPFTIRAVRDSISSRQMSLEQAVKKGLVDQKRRVYRNKKTGEEMDFVDAIDSGLIIAEFEETRADGGSSPTDEIVSKTYAVYEVLDTLTQKQLTFSRAVATGILNQDTGVYINRARRENVSLSEAIKGGFIRAAVISDPKTFDINYSPPESSTDSGNSQQNSPH